MRDEYVLGVCAYCGGDIVLFEGYQTEYYRVEGQCVHDGECLRRFLREHCLVREEGEFAQQDYQRKYSYQPQNQ